MAAEKLSEGSEQNEGKKRTGIKEKFHNFFDNHCGYPLQVWFILGNEFCERFSYYGMHAILVLYLTSMLKMDKDGATTVYHAFNMLCYFSPIFGAIIADSFWGKYKTILYVSFIYAAGNVVVSVTAIPSLLDAVKLAGPMVGLLLIALGTGGIKPCVSAFGGDQFKAGQEELLQSFFSIFYFAINFGSLSSMLVTPILRGDVQCFGGDCYPLAFGVPAILMVVSIFLFLAGSSLYRKVPPEGNIVVQVSKAVCFAIKQRFKHFRDKSMRKEHWMDWAEGEYEPLLINDIKALFKVLFMFLPLPVFWTLFDQQGSRWTLQAMEMNGDIGVFGTLKPDQMQALNPVLVMILIPLFETIIYPICRKCGVLTKPLQKMSVGMALASISFVLAGVLQTHMEHSSSVAAMPATGHANFRILNSVPCPVHVESEYIKSKKMLLAYQTASEYFAVPTKIGLMQIATHDCTPKQTLSVNVKVKEHMTYTLVIGLNGTSLSAVQLSDETDPVSKKSRVRFVHAGGVVQPDIDIQLNKSLSFNVSQFATPTYHIVNAKHYKVRIFSPGNTKSSLVSKELIFGNGGIYTVSIQPNQKRDALQILSYADVSPRPISILWQIPQYTIITAGEVLFSVTGLEFAYSQSPPSMKSCIMAAWLLTVSVGNLIVVIMAGARLTEDMAEEFFFFSGFLAVVVVIFMIMAYFYKYVNYGSSRDEGEYIPLSNETDAEPASEIEDTDFNERNDDDNDDDDNNRTEKQNLL